MYLFAALSGLTCVGMNVHWAISGSRDFGAYLIAFNFVNLLYLWQPMWLFPWRAKALKLKADDVSSFMTSVSWDFPHESSPGLLWIKDGYLTFESSKGIEFALPASEYTYTLDRGLGRIALPRLEVRTTDRSAVATFEVLGLFEEGGRARSEALFEMLQRWTTAPHPEVAVPTLMPWREDAPAMIPASTKVWLSLGMLLCFSSIFLPCYPLLIYSTAFTVFMLGAVLASIRRERELNTIVETPYASLRLPDVDSQNA